MSFETLNTNQEVTIHKDKKPNIIKECNSLKELNASYINYIMQPYEEQVKADEQCMIEYGITNRERYKELYEEISSRVYINNNISESVSTEFEPDYVNTIHNTSFIDRLNDLPYFTPIDMSELGVYSKSNTNYYGEPSDNENNDLDWYKSYELLQYGIVPENFKELNNRRINKLNELSKDFKHHKQTVLELGWNPEVPFSVENRIKATENTRYKLTKNLYKNEFYDATEMVDESYLINGKDIYVEFDKFESGENNVCLITGLPGSGKTTLAKQLASKYNATIVSIDNFSGIKKTGDELKEIDPVLYSYLSTRKSLWENLVNKKLKGNNLTYEVEKYIQYAISYCKKDKKNKYIIEGVQIYWLMNGGELKGCSLICVNTSALKSAIRRVKRVDKINRSEKVRLIDRIVDAIDCAKIDKDAERGYNDFKKEVKDSLNEIAIPDKNPIYIILVYTASPFGKIIKQYTHGIYTHAALSLDSTLDRLYSFNLNNNFSKLGGFSIESIKGYLHDNKDAVMCVYTTFINDENKRKLKKQLDYFVNNVDKTKYSVFNIFTMLVNKPVELANDMICSQFVDRMLKMVDVDITGMASALVTPNDLYKSTSTKIYKVFEGRLDKYNKKKTDKIVSKLSLSNLTEKESPIQFDNEGNLIIVKDIKDIETEYNKSHKLLMNYDRSGNYDAMKPELCKLWYLNNKLEYMIFKTKKGNKEYYDMRARILNDFNKYLTIVNRNDPSYSFSNDYDKSKYSDSSFKISKHTLKHGIDYTKRLVKLYEEDNSDTSFYNNKFRNLINSYNLISLECKTKDGNFIRACKDGIILDKRLYKNIISSNIIEYDENHIIVFNKEYILVTILLSYELRCVCLLSDSKNIKINENISKKDCENIFIDINYINDINLDIINSMKGYDQRLEKHKFDLFGHCFYCAQFCKEISNDLNTTISGMLHDIGKQFIQIYNGTKYSYPYHDQISSDIVKSLLKGFTKNDIIEISNLIKFHHIKFSSKDHMRFIMQSFGFDKKFINKLCHLKIADASAKQGILYIPEEVDEYLKWINN